MCTILLVEDNPLFRCALKDLLKISFKCAVIEESATGGEAVKKFKELRPAIIFLDIRLPDVSGLDLAKLMRESDPSASILMLTSYDSPEYRTAAKVNGANHFFVKGISNTADIVSAVDTAMRGVGNPMFGAQSSAFGF